MIPDATSASDPQLAALLALAAELRPSLLAIRGVAEHLRTEQSERPDPDREALLGSLNRHAEQVLGALGRATRHALRCAEGEGADTALAALDVWLRGLLGADASRVRIVDPTARLPVPAGVCKPLSLHLVLAALGHCRDEPVEVAVVSSADELSLVLEHRAGDGFGSGLREFDENLVAAREIMLDAGGRLDTDCQGQVHRVIAHFPIRTFVPRASVVTS